MHDDEYVRITNIVAMKIRFKCDRIRGYKKEISMSIKYFYNTAFFSLAVMLLSSCTSNLSPKTPYSISYADNTYFGKAPTLVSEEELFRLSDEQKQIFSNYFNDQKLADTLPYVRIFDFLDNSTYDFNYKAATYTAGQTLEFEQGNCMSLAILTTALARFAGTQVGYQLVDSTPVFQKVEDVIIRGIHVRTKLFRSLESDKNVFPHSRGLIVDYFPGGDLRFLKNITEDEFISMYYLNIAAEFIEKDDLVNAYWHALEALKYAPHEASNINTMAVIYRRLGNDQRAEEIYKYGIEISSEKLTLLKNYHLLLKRQGRNRDANEIARKLEKIYDPSPYNWISVADSAYKKAEYSDAIKFYKKAIELAPYLQYGYLGLARVYHAQGKVEKAKSMLMNAMENNYNRENYKMYKAKLAVLSNKNILKIELR